jgi:hypothetical protein
MDLARGLETLFVVAAVSALTPLVVALLSLASVGALAVILTFAPLVVRGNRLERILKEGEHGTRRPRCAGRSCCCCSCC